MGLPVIGGETYPSALCCHEGQWWHAMAYWSDLFKFSNLPGMTLWDRQAARWSKHKFVKGGWFLVDTLTNIGAFACMWCMCIHLLAYVYLQMCVYDNYTSVHLHLHTFIQLYRYVVYTRIFTDTPIHYTNIHQHRRARACKANHLDGWYMVVILQHCSEPSQTEPPLCIFWFGKLLAITSWMKHEVSSKKKEAHDIVYNWWMVKFLNGNRLNVHWGTRWCENHSHGCTTMGSKQIWWCLISL